LIDAYATAPWYVEHLAPIWRELGADAGRFHVGKLAVDAARNLPGVTVAPVAGVDRPILTVAYGDMAAARRAGRTRLVLGQHGAGQSYGSANPSYPGGGHQEGVGLFLVPNETAARATLRTYPDARVEIVGCPKLDVLPSHMPDKDPRPVIAISCHWDARVVPETQTAWRHFKTALLHLARDHRVIGHAHPRAMRHIGPYYRAARIEIVPAFVDVLRRADLYVCDNSSSMFEFAATGRPVVVMNAPHYRREVDFGLRFWEASRVGVNVDWPRDLPAAVARAIECRPDDVAAREAALDLVYQPRHGAAALAAAAVRDWATAAG
jgi:hypothetical protein